MIPHSRPTFDQNDFDGALQVLKSGQIVQGKQTARFEENLSSLIGVRGGVAVSSGTAALHLALISLGIGKGDEVILPSFVCTAPLNAIYYVGATPVIAEVDRFTFNVAVNDLKKRITKKTKAVIVPHMFGLPADIADIVSLGVPIIEDCAHSIGSRYKDNYTGSFGVLSIFSFYATKVIAAGEGGMVLSDNEQLISIIRHLRDYDEKDDFAVRYNYKMTDIQAALGISQLKKLSLFIQKRKEIADKYGRIFDDLRIPAPFVPKGREHIYYRYVVLLENAQRFMDSMMKRRVACRRPVFKPLHRYLGLPGYATTDLVWERAVSIPIYPSLTDEEVGLITDSVKLALS
ncbi:MAG: DegT/DnrJ/EryC1/StrS family aminotransferase [Syntrophales bacterium]|jgi:dTDP-4-amino-4,6-dideoxygalactose transaminase